MIKNKKILGILLIVAMFIAIINIPTTAKAEYIADKEWSTIDPGEVIYFDTTGLGWDTVQIYFWQDGNGEYKSWTNADTMTKVDGKANIYSFTAPEDMEKNKYNMVIFKNGKDGNENQTINLGFIEPGFVYKVDSWENGKRLGYWYLYDNSSIVSHLENVKEYQSDKQYYTEASYGNLDELITKAVTESNTEIRLQAEEDINGNKTGRYYIEIDYTMAQIDDIINNLEVNPDILNQKIITEENNKEEYEKTYTPDSLKNLTEKIETAKELANKTDLTVDDIKQAIKEIDNAKVNLIKKADKTKLEEAIKTVDELDKTIYTDESIENLEKIVEASKNVLQNDNATQQEVDDSVQKIEEGIKALEKKLTEDDSQEDNGLEEDKNQEEDKKQENNNSEVYNNQEQESTNNEVTPKTGDVAVVYGSLLAIAIIVFVSTTIYSRKKKQK